MSSIKFRFEVWKSYVNKIGEMLLNNEYLISEIFKKDEDNYNKFKEDYENNFIKFKAKERFTIPIIGKISSGKSTFLNSILLGNYLSCSSNIDTKFVCILRHKQNCKYPKLFNCVLKQEKIDYKYRDFEYYYFEKTEELKGDVLENIKGINQNLNKYEKEVNIDERDINKYFYILELNIPLFNENKELGDYFELMDIPGLNEENDFYIQKIIPTLVNKCLFSIYIFDLEKYRNDDTCLIYKNYSQQLNKFYNTNSIYILNKIDMISEEDKRNLKDENHYFNEFKNYLSSQLFVDLKKNFFLKLNSKELFNNVNAFSNLKTYILHIIDKINMAEVDELFSLLEYIKQSLVEYFQIDKDELELIFNDENNDNYNNFFDEEEFNEINDSISSTGLSADFEEEEFKRIKFIFQNSEKKYLKIPLLDKVLKIILESMNKSMDEFFNVNNALELMKIFKNSINKTFENENEKNKYMEICDNLLNSFFKELERKSKLKNIEWNISKIDPLKTIIDSLIKLDPKNISLKQLKKDFISMTYFIYNYRKIRIPLLGGYSTGKSSFLNNLIGKDILPVDISTCTNRGIIIRHSKNEIPQLFKTKFTHVENPDYWYFKDEERPICEGEEKVKNKLKELNNEKVEFEDAFVVLKIPLQLFSELEYSDKKLKKILEEKLELIDFPGLDVSNNFYQEKIFSPLMRFSDGFIFVNECDLIQERGNLKILTNIMNQIKTRKFSFSFSSCFFLLHKLDKSLDININKSKEIFENLFFKDANDANFNVNKFSSKLYHIYIEFFNKYIKDFYSFIRYIIENLFKPEEKKKIKNYKDFLNLINNITKKLKFQINKKFIKNYKNKNNENYDLINENLYHLFQSLNQISDKNEDNNNLKEVSKIIKEIHDNYSYINDNHKFQNQRVLSNANGLFDSLIKLFIESYEYTENQFIKYFEEFIDNFNNLFILIDLKIYGTQFKNQIIYNKTEKLNNDLKQETDKLLDESQKYIIEQKAELEKKNKEIIDKFFEEYSTNKKVNNVDYFTEIERKIQSNINEFLTKINEEIFKFYNIFEKLGIKEKNNTKININYKEKSLNKDSRISKEFVYKDSVVANIFKGIGNIFISLRNWINEKEQIEKNFKDYLDEINILISNCEETYKNEINIKKNIISKKIEDNLSANKNNFDGIKNNRDEYEAIKTNYYKIIN